MSERVVENLNQAMHALFASDPQVYLIGEDLADPYGGAFKVSKGLTTTYPDRVFSTPISEQAIMGMANGLALCGRKPIVEFMFGDFIMLGFDMIYNFAAKSVSMYGQRMSMPMVIRCPYGGNRGYGPTHSQSPQKHFIGIPDLALFEMSPLQDNLAVFQRMFSLKHPCLFFENKVLYSKDMATVEPADDIFVYKQASDGLSTHVGFKGITQYDATIIVAGGQFYDALSAAKKLLLEHEIAVQLIVPVQLYPFCLQVWGHVLKASRAVFMVEEGVAGGSWGEAMAWEIGEKIDKALLARVFLINSLQQVIPASVHLEKQVLVQEDDIIEKIRKVLA